MATGHSTREYAQPTHTWTWGSPRARAFHRLTARTQRRPDILHYYAGQLELNTFSCTSICVAPECRIASLSLSRSLSVSLSLSLLRALRPRREREREGERGREREKGREYILPGTKASISTRRSAAARYSQSSNSTPCSRGLIGNYLAAALYKARTALSCTGVRACRDTRRRFIYAMTALTVAYASRLLASFIEFLNLSGFMAGDMSEGFIF